MFIDIQSLKDALILLPILSYEEKNTDLVPPQYSRVYHSRFIKMIDKQFNVIEISLKLSIFDKDLIPEQFKQM